MDWDEKTTQILKGEALALFRRASKMERGDGWTERSSSELRRMASDLLGKCLEAEDRGGFVC